MPKNKHRKHINRKLNSILREINKSIYNDDAWLGRFVIRQVRNHYYSFDDGSGGILYAYIRMYDRKTGLYKDLHEALCNETRLLRGNLYYALNSFIVEDINADWRETAVDYRFEPISDRIFDTGTNELHFYYPTAVKEIQYVRNL